MKIKNIIKKILLEQESELKNQPLSTAKRLGISELTENKMIQLIGKLYSNNLKEDLTVDEIFDKLIDRYGFNQEQSYYLIFKASKVLDDFESFDEISNYWTFDIDTILRYWDAGDFLKFLDEIDESFKFEYGREIKEDGGKQFLMVDSWCDFKDLFRDSGDRDIFERIFCDEDFFEFFAYNDDFDGNINLYTTDESIDIIIKHIESKYLNKTINVDTVIDDEDIQELNPNEDGDILLNHDNINIIKNDEDLLFKLISKSDDLHDLKMDLLNFINSAYNQVADDEITGKFINEVQSLFGESKWVTTKIKNREGKESDRSNLVFDVTGLPYKTYVKYMNYFKADPNNEGSFLYVLKEVLDFDDDLLDPRINYDYFYPDHDKVAKNFVDELKGNL